MTAGSHVQGSAAGAVLYIKSMASGTREPGSKPGSDIYHLCDLG